MSTKAALVGIALAALVAGCSGAAATQQPATLVPVVRVTPAAATVAGAITIKSGDSSLVDYRGGRYVFTWTVPATCQSLQLELAPTSGSTSIPVAPKGTKASGSVTIDVPEGRAYLNGGGVACPYSVTITPA